MPGRLPSFAWAARGLLDSLVYVQAGVQSATPATRRHENVPCSIQSRDSVQNATLLGLYSTAENFLYAPATYADGRRVIFRKDDEVGDMTGARVFVVSDDPNPTLTVYQVVPLRAKRV